MSIIKTLNEALDVATKFADLKSIRKGSVSDKERLAMLKVGIEELRRTYDHVTNIYDQLRAKALAFIAGEIALVGFLFVNDIRFPAELYGQIIFIGGALAFLSAFGLLLWTISAVRWKIPGDFQKHKAMAELYPTELALTEYIYDEYVAAIQHCMPLVSNKAKRFNSTIYLLSAGVIIVLLIKYGGHIA